MSSTFGVKLDDTTRTRLEAAAQRTDRTPHWLVRQAIHRYLEQIERGEYPETDEEGPAEDVEEEAPEEAARPQPFLAFAESVHPQSVLREAITAAYRRPEPEMVAMLL